MEKILVVAAHPDDEILGVGGTLLRHKENNDEVFACILTKPRNESIEYQMMVKHASLSASKLIGFNDEMFCDFPNKHLDNISVAIIASMLENIMDKIKPTIIYTHYKGDLHQDHKKVHDAVMIAARPFRKHVKKIYCFETCGATGYDTPSNSTTFIPNTFVDISRQIRKKIQAVSQYSRTELRDYPHPRSIKGLEIQAQRWGLFINTSAAEAFQLVREIS